MSITSSQINYPMYKEISNPYGPLERFEKKTAEAEWQPYGFTYPIYRDMPVTDGTIVKQIKVAMGAEWVDIPVTDDQQEGKENV